MTCSQKRRCRMPRSPFCKRRGESLSSGNLCCKSCFDIMPSCGEIRIPGRQSQDTMQVIWQKNDGLDDKWPALAGSLEHLPKVVNVFGQEIPAAFQQRDCEEERATRNKDANILRHTLGLTQFPKAGCVSLSRPTAKNRYQFKFKRRGDPLGSPGRPNHRLEACATVAPTAGRGKLTTKGKVGIVYPAFKSLLIIL